MAMYPEKPVTLVIPYKAGGSTETMARVFSIALGNELGVGSNVNPFGVMGVTRGLTRLFALELPFYIAVIGLMVANHSADISVIISNQVC